MEEMFSSLICFYLFFLYISFGLSLGKALRQPVNVGGNSITKIWSQISYGNTALPLATDYLKTFKPHIGDLDAKNLQTPHW